MSHWKNLHAIHLSILYFFTCDLQEDSLISTMSRLTLEPKQDAYPGANDPTAFTQSYDLNTPKVRSTPRIRINLPARSLPAGRSTNIIFLFFLL